VSADLSIEETLVAAFKGANVIFTTSDFWVAAYDTNLLALAAAEKRTINELAYDVELQQQKNMIHAAAATISTLDRLVFSTLSAARELSKGKYTQVFHFDGKAASVDYLRKSYPDLAKKTSFIHLPLYIEVLKNELKPTKEPDGRYVVNAPIKGDRGIPFGSPSVITGPFVRALVEAPPGKNLMACSGVMSLNEWTAKLGKKLKIDCSFREVPPQAIVDSIPIWGGEFAEMFQYMEEFGYDGGDPTIVYPDQVSLIIRDSALNND
jgi:hypothetical protein